MTESTIMSDQTRGLHILRKLKAMGISVAMDDFGTGYSSLATLHAFPFDKIKLDQSFVKRLPEDAAAAAIVRTVLALGASLGMPVLAEGIETEAQWHFLAREGCAKGQGYLFARPVSLAPTAGRDRRRGALRSRRAAGRSNHPRDSGGIARLVTQNTACLSGSPRPKSVRMRSERVRLRPFRASIFSTRQENGMADNKKKRGGADRALIALSEPYEVAYWSKKFKITPAKLKSAVKKAGRSAKNVEAYIKLQKHKAADRARIAVSQPYEVGYWSKKFKVTPAKLKAAVAAVGHSSKNVGAYLAGSKAKKRTKKALKESCQENCQEAREEKGRLAGMRSPGEAKRDSGYTRDPGCASLTRTTVSRQFAAKQYISPSPPVLFRSACEQPPSGPREGCDVFQDFDGSSSRRPLRSKWPTIAAPCVLLVQFLQVRSSPAANAVPSACDPVSTSWRFGVSPAPLMTSPFSESAVCLVRLLLALCSSATSLATTAPLEFFHGPLPMRSRAFTAGAPSAACVER